MDAIKNPNLETLALILVDRGLMKAGDFVEKWGDTVNLLWAEHDGAANKPATKAEQVILFAMRRELLKKECGTGTAKAIDLIKAIVVRTNQTDVENLARNAIAQLEAGR